MLDTHEEMLSADFGAFQGTHKFLLNNLVFTRGYFKEDGRLILRCHLNKTSEKLHVLE